MPPYVLPNLSEGKEGMYFNPGLTFLLYESRDEMSRFRKLGNIEILQNIYVINLYNSLITGRSAGRKQSQKNIEPLQNIFFHKIYYIGT